MTGMPSVCGESPLTYSTERGEKIPILNLGKFYKK